MKFKEETKKNLFGDSTENAIKRFQSENHLDETGIADELTISSMYESAKEKDKIDFEFIDVQQIDEFTVQLTVRVPDATDIDKDFTKLGVQFPSTPESNDYYLMSNRVVVN